MPSLLSLHILHVPVQSSIEPTWLHAMETACITCEWQHAKPVSSVLPAAGLKLTPGFIGCGGMDASRQTGEGEPPCIEATLVRPAHRTHLTVPCGFPSSLNGPGVSPSLSANHCAVGLGSSSSAMAVAEGCEGGCQRAAGATDRVEEKVYAKLNKLLKCVPRKTTARTPRSRSSHKPCLHAPIPFFSAAAPTRPFAHARECRE